MNHFFGPILIAAKNIGDQICTQVAILTNNMTKALNPVIVKSEGSGDRDIMISLSYKSCKYSFLLYLLLAIPFIFNTFPLLKIWLRNVPDWAVLFCQLQVIRSLFEQLFVPLRISLMAQGSVKQVNVIDLFLGIITFLFLFILYRMGYSAQWHYYISILFLVFISGAAKVYLCSKLCGMRSRDYLQTVIVPCMIVLLSAILVSYAIKVLLSNYNALVIVSLQIAFIVLIVLFCGLSKMEKSVLLSKVMPRSF